MRRSPLVLAVVVGLLLAGCGKPAATAAPGVLAPIDSPLVQQPVGNVDAEVGEDLQVQREQARRTAENSRVSLPAPRGSR